MASKKSSGGSDSWLSESRKLEVVGILILAIAALIAISIITYHKGDYGVIQSLSSDSIFQVDKGPALRIQNGLGVVGAYLSYFFVYYLFGYISLFIPGLTFLYGWYVFRNRDITELNWHTTHGIWSMILLATILGWFGAEYDWTSEVWSGFTGYFLASVLRTVTGYYGSIVILTALAIVTVIMLVNRDLQTVVDGVKGWIEDQKETLAEKREERKEAKAKQKKIKAQQQAEAQQVQQAQQEQQKVKAPSTSQATSSHNSPQKVEAEPVTQQTEPQESEQPEKPESIDRIVEASKKREQERREKEQAEALDLEGRPPRAQLEKEMETEDEDDVDISVYVGKGEEEAGKKELDKQNKKKAKKAPVIKYKFPTIELLDSPPNEGNEVDLEEINENKRIILDKLKRHKIEILSINAIVGPTVTLYELEPAPDVKISKIESYANDLKMATAAQGLRILAPIPGRSAVGIEVPNGARETVYIKSVINTKKFVETDKELPIAFGKTIENDVFMVDLTKMPHLLIAGATGSGKSVGINTIITCLLYKCKPDDLKFVLVDPKKIELSLYQKIENQFLACLPDAEEPIITDTAKALETLVSVTMEMDERYDLLKDAMVRDIRAYNEKFDAGELDESDGHRHLPYIVVIIDELADLMMTAGKKIEEPIARLAQLARAIGIHLVVATQRPSVNVITGTIKANFPARVAYQVASKVDSRTILDTGGADQLVGRGDMLFTQGGGMTRIQNAFVSTEEVEKITDFIGKQAGFDHPFELPQEEEELGSGIPDPLEDKDELFEDAAKLVVMHQQGSVSLLQRKLKLGYNRAGRIIDQLFAAGVVGPYQGSTARDVLCEDEEELKQTLAELDD
ncbi:MAG: DNA translocase FtsK 4TM domain-containing protein [Bacteroidota bacterium]